MEFKISDTVKICDLGKIYPTYSNMAIFFNMKNWAKGNHYLFNKNIINSDPDLYKIINIHEHLNPIYQGRILAHIRNVQNDKEYIIGIDGLELYEPYEEFISESEFCV